ncbi:MAG: SDR family oxidoreductase [Burkholderiaceae bacterium]|nr:SDR family oxidoreductase [Burkholderiaceae bacterium]
MAVITGGAGGNGRAIARAFHDAGYRVALVDVDKASLDAARRDAFRDRSECTTVAADVSIPADCERAANQIVDAHGRIDALVNGAGLYRLNRIDDADFRATYGLLMSVNVEGVLNMTLAARAGLERSQGAIVNIASIESTLAGSASIGYTVSKTAVAGLTRALAADLAPRGIRVNAVAPGIVDTPMVAHLAEDERAGRRAKARIALKRFASPDEIANVVLFLASPAASYMTGSVVVADGGYLLS